MRKIRPAEGLIKNQTVGCPEFANYSNCFSFAEALVTSLPNISQSWLGLLLQVVSARDLRKADDAHNSIQLGLGSRGQRGTDEA